MTFYRSIKIFPGLNALRFFAALLVVLHHGETIRNNNHLQNFEWLGFFRNGGNAVTFFFVLSGFLITYLLLKEHDTTGRVKVGNFYLKRVLRIWPLYFLLVTIGVFILPLAFSVLGVNYEMPYTFGKTWYYFLFFLPGLVTFFYGHHFLEPLWSIGVEEVFYIMWAPLFKLGRKHILSILITVVILKLALVAVGLLFIKSELFNYIVNTFKFEAMAIGGIGAYFVFNLKVRADDLLIFKRAFQIIILSILAIFLIFHNNIANPIWEILFRHPLWSNLTVDFLFLYLIICVSLVDKSCLKLNGKVLSYLGEISYGIYMYHLLVIFTTMLFLKRFLLTLNTPMQTIVFYTAVISITILTASLSKRFFENFFLGLKSRLK
jgi:peptidoglycan/LPS O-acetylase OafA/YrhL